MSSRSSCRWIDFSNFTTSLTATTHALRSAYNPSSTLCVQERRAAVMADRCDCNLSEAMGSESRRLAAESARALTSDSALCFTE
eukprot:scaffold269791_cov30-Tisochrysis_lutea.AAC.2